MRQSFCVFTFPRGGLGVPAASPLRRLRRVGDGGSPPRRRCFSSETMYFSVIILTN